MKVVFFLKGAVRIDWRVQDPATFNLDAVKAKIEAMMKAHEGQ